MIVRLKESPEWLCRTTTRRFQFYDSPIKSSNAICVIQRLYTSFNSMIVRLKVDLCLAEDVTLKKFQFYDSPIKSGIDLTETQTCTWFQFYDSPIKRSTGKSPYFALRSFQFYDSPIKSYPFAPYNPPFCIGFNSMIVRLKGRRDKNSKNRLTSFNSMIVRLKGFFKFLIVYVAMVSILW